MSGLNIDPNNLKFGSPIPSALTGFTDPASQILGMDYGALSKFGMDTNPIGMDIALPEGWAVGANGKLGAGLPGAGAANSSGLGLNVGTAQLALSGLGTIANLWGGFEARNLAKKQFKFQKDFAEKNYANQISSYNTALEDRSRSRAVVEGQSSSEAEEYIKKNRLG